MINVRFRWGPAFAVCSIEVILSFLSKAGILSLNNVDNDPTKCQISTHYNGHNPCNNIGNDGKLFTVREIVLWSLVWNLLRILRSKWQILDTIWLSIVVVSLRFQISDNLWDDEIRKFGSPGISQSVLLCQYLGHTVVIITTKPNYRSQEILVVQPAFSLQVYAIKSAKIRSLYTEESGWVTSVAYLIAS